MGKSPLAPDASKPSCAGHGCEDRKECLRYRRHLAPNQTWISADIERQQQGGECPAFDRAPVKRA